MEVKADLTNLEAKLEHLETLHSTSKVYHTIPQGENSFNIYNFLQHFFTSNNFPLDIFMPLATQVIATGVFLFLGCFVFHHFLREDIRAFIKGVLNSNVFSNQVIREHVSFEHNETRELLLQVVSDLESFSNTLVQQNTMLHEISVSSIVQSLDKHTLIINKLLNSQNIILSNQSKDYFEHLKIIHSTIEELNSKIITLDLKTTLLNDAITVLVQADSSLSGIDLLGTL